MSSKGVSDIPEFPPGLFVYKNHIEFTRGQGVVTDGWHLIGPAEMLKIGQTVTVVRFREDDTEVRVIEHVARRTVRTRTGALRTYAVATFDRLAPDAPPA